MRPLLCLLTLSLLLTTHGSLALADPPKAARAHLSQRLSARMQQAKQATKRVGGRFGRGLARAALGVGGVAMIGVGIYQGPSPSGVACVATGCNMIALATSKKKGFWPRVGLGGAATIATSWFGGQLVGGAVQTAAPVLKIGATTTLAAASAVAGRVVGKVTKEQIKRVTDPIVSTIDRRIIDPAATRLDRLADRIGF